MAKLLNPLTQNEYTITVSAEAVDKIHKILIELFDQGYRYFSFEMTLLFTNVPLGKTINVILERLYKDNITDTKLKKSTIKKLIKDYCTKTVFSFNNIIYKQKDDASMGFSLGSVLANVIMAEMEKEIVKSTTDSRKLKLYMR